MRWLRRRWPAEFARGLRTMGIPCGGGADDLAALWALVDADADGRVAYEELLRSMRDGRARVLLVEQSRDARKFNRGKLLNAGFDLAHGVGGGR